MSDLTASGPHTRPYTCKLCRSNARSYTRSVGSTTDFNTQSVGPTSVCTHDLTPDVLTILPARHRPRRAPQHQIPGPDASRGALAADLNTSYLNRGQSTQPAKQPQMRSKAFPASPTTFLEYVYNYKLSRPHPPNTRSLPSSMWTILLPPPPLLLPLYLKKREREREG